MLYKFAKVLLTVIVKLLYRMEVHGSENLPADGPVIVVANHASLMDPIFMGCSLKRQVFFMAKEQLFKAPLLGTAIRAVGAFPVKRGAGDREAIRSAIGVLKQGKVLGMFPEGTRYKDGKIHPLRSGAALLAVKGKARILPMVIFGSHRIKFLRFPKIKVVIGPSFSLTSGGENKDKETLREGTEKIYSSLLALWTRPGEKEEVEQVGK